MSLQQPDASGAAEPGARPSAPAAEPPAGASAGSHGRDLAAMRDGARATLPAIVGLGIWGAVAGVAMVQSGLTPLQAVGMSLLVYAGTSQLASLPLIAAGASLGTIAATALLVNLRFVLASALIARDFRSLPLLRRVPLASATIEANLAIFLARGRDGRTLRQRERFLRGSVATTWLTWQAGTMVGIAGASMLPRSGVWLWIAQLAILAIAAPMLRMRGAPLAAAVGAVVAALTAGWPAGTGLASATVAGMATALIVLKGAR